MMAIRRLVFRMAIVAVALTMVGCGGGGHYSATKQASQFHPNGTTVNGRVIAMTANITPAQATAAALAAQPGTAETPELGEENGVAVYEVSVTAANGTKYDVKINAATGTYLRSDPDDNSDDGTDNNTNDSGDHQD